jgi:hypothetical protein
VGSGSLNIIVRDEVDEPFSGLLLAGQSDGRKNGRTEPRVARPTERFLQQSKCLGDVGLG